MSGVLGRWGCVGVINRRGARVGQVWAAIHSWGCKCFPGLDLFGCSRCLCNTQRLQLSPLSATTEWLPQGEGGAGRAEPGHPAGGVLRGAGAKRRRCARAVHAAPSCAVLVACQVGSGRAAHMRVRMLCTAGRRLDGVSKKCFQVGMTNMTNGLPAGKSTMINILTGFMEPTAGGCPAGLAHWLAQRVTLRLLPSVTASSVEVEGGMRELATALMGGGFGSTGHRCAMASTDKGSPSYMQAPPAWRVWTSGRTWPQSTPSWGSAPSTTCSVSRAGQV